MRYRTVGFLVALATLVLPAAAAAQGEWEHTFVLYGWGTYLDGDSEFGQAATEVDVDVDQVFDSLETAAMARYRGANERWAVVLDGIFAGFGATRHDPVRVDLDLDEWVLQADAAYRFSETAEVLFGVRYVRMEADLDVGRDTELAIHRDADVSLWDPVVGLRTLAPLGERWAFQGQVDVGGGANMDLTWQAMLHFGYRFNDSISTWLGYRALSMEFDEGGSLNRLSMDLLTHGPSAGLAFQF